VAHSGETPRFVIGRLADRIERLAGHRVVVLAVLLLTVGATNCARTDLDPGDVEFGESREPNVVVDAGPDADIEDADIEDADIKDADVDVPDVPDVCVPSEEVCNGVDDDCNGNVDEVAPVPCPDGGFSHCIAGVMSECPTQCDTCMPGSKTICFVSYCYYWGVQTCHGDGKSLSGCVEEPPPRACREIAQKHQKSRQLQQCCIDEGYCCKDDFDLDNDGSTQDYVGNCSEVLCGDE
jgi:hypothetical protein